jgi:hypothetical protein
MIEAGRALSEVAPGTRWVAEQIVNITLLEENVTLANRASMVTPFTRPVITSAWNSGTVFLMDEQVQEEIMMKLMCQKETVFLNEAELRELWLTGSRKGWWNTN